MYKISKSAKICDWDVQIKMSLSPELMGDIFEFIEKSYSL